MTDHAADAATCECPTDQYGTRTHPADCPTVAFIREIQKRLLPELMEMHRVRRLAEAKARNYVIG